MSVNVHILVLLCGKLLLIYCLMLFHTSYWVLGSPGGAAGKEQPANAGDMSDMVSILVSRRYAGERHGNPLQYSCLEKSMDRGA